MFAVGPAFFGGGSAPAALAITGAFAPATVGTAYSSSIPITGGLEPYSLTGGSGVVSGSLDSGFALSITGTTGARFLTLTCASPATADTMTFTSSVGSSDGQTATSAQSVAVAAVQTTWSATNKSTDITLSSGNTICTMTGPGAAGGTVLSDTGHGSGKFYAELRCIGWTAGSGAVGATGCGLHLGTSTLTNWIGQDANGWGSWSENSSSTQRDTAYNNVTSNIFAAGVNPTGTNVRIAVDLTAGKLWLSYYGSSTWIGGGDPASGTSPTYTFTPSGTYYLAYTPRTTTAQGQLVPVASWLNSAPTGFGVWT